MSIILALDPSTGSEPGTGCGVALVEYPARRILGLTTIIPNASDADLSLVVRADRIRRIRTGLSVFLEGRDHEPTHVAYELPYRGSDTIEAIHWLTGTLLSMPALALLPLVPISAAEAKKAWGCAKLSRADGKIAATLWANRTFRLSLGPTQHDMADALAVAEAAWSRVRAGELLPLPPARQLAMSLPKPRKARKR